MTANERGGASDSTLHSVTLTREDRSNTGQQSANVENGDLFVLQ